MDKTHSVTALVRKLHSDKQEEFQAAAREIWAKYSDRLLDLARQQLQPRIRRRADEEDVLQSMYKSFCLRRQRGEYSLEDRNDLWNLLVRITENKAKLTARKHSRQRRDGRREAHEPGGAGNEELPPLVEGVAARDPIPEEAVILNSELERLLNMLPDDLRQMVLWKVEGWTNEEIAQKLDCVVRTVGRKLSLVREIWKQDWIER